MIAGYEHRWQVEAQLRAFEHERRTVRSERHLEAIEASEKIFRAELERLGEGDYPEPEVPERSGAFAYISPTGHEYSGEEAPFRSVRMGPYLRAAPPVSSFINP